MSDLRSEAETLASIISALEDAKVQPGGSSFQRESIQVALHLSRVLLRQVIEGYHVNPPHLAVFTNPPEGRFQFFRRMSRNVHEIRYVHAELGGNYRHAFESGDVEMYAITRGRAVRDLLITGGHEQPLWEDFQ